MEVRHVEQQKAEMSVGEGGNGAKRTSFTFLILYWSEFLAVTLQLSS